MTIGTYRQPPTSNPQMLPPTASIGFRGSLAAGDNIGAWLLANITVVAGFLRIALQMNGNTKTVRLQSSRDLQGGDESRGFA